MSAKTLVQILLFIVIILIISTIYIIYFKTNKLNNQIITLNSESESQLLDDGLIIKEELNNKTQREETTNKRAEDLEQNYKKKIVKNDNLDEKKKNKTIENVIEKIQYTTSDNNGNKYEFFAKSGKTNIENNNILDLTDVDGLITTIDNQKIFITSNFAKYNSQNQNSKFFEKVEVLYQDRIIKCNNLDIDMKNNIAIAYNNVVVYDDNSLMKAGKVTINTLTKEMIIDPSKAEKINIYSN